MSDYTDTATLKTRLGITDTSDDTTLGAIVTAVSRAIDDYCGRRFYAATETRYYTAHCFNELLVDDLLSVTTLATDDGTRTYPYTWATTDYDLEPANAPLAAQPQPYWKISVPLYGSYWFPPMIPRGVKVIGSWGFSASVPSVVSEACLLQCERSFRAIDVPMGTAGGGEFGVSMTGAGLHPFVKQMLSPLRRLEAA